MNTIFSNFCSEGVLIIASSKALQKEYENKEFDYGFPEGLKNLLKQNMIIALTTEGGDDFVIHAQNEDVNFFNHDFNNPKVTQNYLKLEENDEVLFLNHAQFTMICNSCKGNYGSYLKKWEWDSIKKISNLEKGSYKIIIEAFIDEGKDESDDAIAILKTTIIKLSDEQVPFNKIFDVDGYEV